MGMGIGYGEGGRHRLLFSDRVSLSQSPSLANVQYVSINKQTQAQIEPQTLYRLLYLYLRLSVWYKNKFPSNLYGPLFLACRSFCGLFL